MLKPFHESIIDAINACSTVGDASVLADLILSTKIPKNHEAIISAWKEKMNLLNRSTDFGVEKNILAQKEFDLQLKE